MAMLSPVAFPKSALIFWENIVKEIRYLSEHFQKFLKKLAEYNWSIAFF